MKQIDYSNISIPIHFIGKNEQIEEPIFKNFEVYSHENFKNFLKNFQDHFNDNDLIIIAKSNHTLIENFNYNNFIQRIIEAHQIGCDILLGNLSGFIYSVPITENLFWIDIVDDCGYVVIFKKFLPIFKSISKTRITGFSLVDFANHTTNKVSIYPFISFPKILNPQDKNKRLVRKNMLEFSGFLNSSLKLKNYHEAFKRLLKTKH